MSNLYMKTNLYSCFVLLLGMIGLNTLSAQTYLTEDFESAFVGTPAAPTGWTQSRYANGGDFTVTGPTVQGPKDWQRNTWSGTAWTVLSSVPGIVPTGAQSGTGVLWMNDAMFTANGATLLGNYQERQIESPTIDLTAATSPYLTFHLFHNVTVNSQYTIRIMGSNDNGATWKIIGYALPNASQLASGGVMSTGTPWQKIRIKIPNSIKSGTTKIGFSMLNSAVAQNIWIDNVSVAEFTPTTITSAGSGNWNVAATWVGGAVPTADNNVVIATGHNVTLNQNATRVQDLTVDGTFSHLAASSATEIMYVYGNLNISNTGTYINGNGGLTFGKILYLGGNLVNNGTANFQLNNNTLIMAGGDAVSIGGVGTFTSATTTGVPVVGRINNLWCAASGGLTFNTPITAVGAINLINGIVYSNGNLQLGMDTTVAAGGANGGTPALPTNQTIQVGKGSFAAPGPIFANLTGTRSTSYTSFAQMPQVAQTLTTGFENPIVSGTRTVTGTLTMNSHNNVALSYPLNVGNANTGSLALTRGILITTPTNILTTSVIINPTVGTPPSFTTPTATAGSYISGPLRTNFPTTANSNRNYPLGEGTNFNNASGSAMTPVANALRNLNVASGATPCTAGTNITASIVGVPSGAANAPLAVMIGTRAYYLDANGGPDLPATATLTLNAMNTASPIPTSISDVITGNAADIRIGQSTSLTGPWTERSVTSATAFANNTLVPRTTAAAAPGPIAPLGTNGGYFGWGTTGIVKDMAATALATPSLTGCYSATQTITITIINNGIVAINFATDPVTVTCSGTSPSAVVTNFTPVVINTGTLASGATQNVVITTTYNMSAAGTYTFNASTSVVGDMVPANNAMSPAFASWNNPFSTLAATAIPAGICTGSSTTLGLNPAYSATNYSVMAIPYSPQTGGTPVSPVSGDDAVSAAIPLGFDFTFYGTAYVNPSIFIYTNGFVQISASSGSTTTYGQALPNVLAPNNIIAGIFEDLNAPVGAITYFTTGTAPNRVFNVSYNNVPYFVASGSTNFQIQMYETTNIIEVHIFENNDAGTGQTPTCGIENAAGTLAAFPVGHNQTMFSVSATGAHEAWRFLPPVTGITYSWTPTATLTGATTLNPVATPPTSTTYNVTLAAGGCTISASVPVTVTNTPSLPTVTNNTICGYGAGTLTASGAGGTMNWLTSAAGGPIVNVGATYSPTVGTTTSYYVFESPAQTTQNVGLSAAAAGITAFASASNNGQLFDVLSLNGIIINSVDVWPSPTTPIGTPISIQLYNNLGVAIGQPVTTTTTVQGAAQTIILNMFVPNGTGWRLIPIQNPNLKYHQTGFVNPYTIPSVVSLTGGWNGTGLINIYAFFYNWSVVSSCYSPLATATLTVTAPPALTITPPNGGYCGNTGSVSMTASGYTNYAWSPATGLSATTGATVTASPTATTTYLCTGTNGTCADTQTVVISVNPLPTVSITSSATTTVCPSSNFTLTAVASSSSTKQVGFDQIPGQAVVAPYNGGNTSIRTQMMFTVAELNAAGFYGPSNINAIGWFVSSKLSTGAYQAFNIDIAHSALTVFGATTYLTTGFTNVFSGSVTTVLGWNMHNFTTPFAWDGVSSIVVNVCFTNPAPVGFDQCYYTNTAVARTITGNLIGCGAATGALALTRPNTRFLGGLVSYNWSPGTASTLAVSASPTPGTYSKTCIVTDPATSCTASATYSYTVSTTPTAPVITVAAPGAVSFCPAGGSVTLNMTGTTTASLQWQSSPAGANTWTNIAGAIGTSYTSPIITTSRDYRLQLTCGGTSVSNVITVTVGAPSMLSTTPGFRCGPGTVTLGGTATGFINWYDAPTGGNLVGAGTVLTTPSITANTTYYAEAWATGGASATLPLPTTYCTPTLGFTGATTDYIDGFTLNTLSNLASGDNPADFALYPQTTTVQAGMTYSLSVITGATFAQGAGVWIDYNQDGLFTGANEFVYASPNTGAATTFTGSVTIPLTVATGQTRVRVVAHYAAVPLATESCGHTSFGEYEDYIISMLGGGAVVCTGTPRMPALATINALPTVTVGSNAPVCAGADLNLTSTGGVSYSWTGPNGFTSALQNPSITAVTAANGGTYTVTATNATPCSLAVSTVVSISPVPVLTSSVTPTAVCTGTSSTINLNATATPGYTGYSVAGIAYAPQTGGTPVSPVSGDDVASAAIPLGFSFNFYGVTYTDLIVYTNGYVELGTTASPTSYGQTLPNAATPNKIIAGVWEDLNAGVGAITHFTTGTAPNRVFNIKYNNVPYWVGTGNTNFQIQLFETTNIVEVHVFENNDGGLTQTPTLGIENAAGTAAVFPAAHNLTMFPVSATGAHEAWRFTPAGVTYSWTGPNSFSSTLDSTTILNATTASTGTYNITVTNSLNCTTSVATPVTVNPNPVPVITAGGPTTFCTGGSVSLDAGGPYNSYSWSTGANTQSVTASTSGSYTVTVTDASLCSGTSAPTVITLNPSPTGVTATASVTSLCLPGTLDLTGTGTSSGTPTFSWTATPVGFTSAAQSPTGITPPVGATTYTLVVTDPNNLCTTTISTPAINVGTNPNSAITYAGSAAICAGTSLSLVASTPSSATLSYQWFESNTPIASATSVTYSPTASGNYSVLITETSSPNCADTSAATTVTINPLPVLTVTPTNILCYGAGTGSATVAATGTPSLNYSWNTTPAQVLATANNLPAGTYIVNVTDGNNCSDTAWVTITQPVAPFIADAGIDVTLCSGGATTLNGTSVNGTGTVNYVWDNAATQGGSVSPATTTTYIVTATDGNNCTDNDTTVVTINQAATVAAGTDISVCGLSAITLGGSIGGSATVGTWSGTYAGAFSSLTNPTGAYTPNASEAGSTLTFTLTTNDPDGTGPCAAVSDAVDVTIGGYSTTLAPPTSAATPWIADYESTDVFGWTHYYDNNGTPANNCDDYIILSLQNANTGGNTIGHIGDPGFSVKVAGQGAYTLTNATTPYVTAASWYVMGRYWEVTPVTQPVNDVNVKFYFTNTDYTDVNAVSAFVNTSPTQMAFYKINNGVGGTPSYNPDPAGLHSGVPVAAPFAYDGTGYWQYINGGTASTSTWAYTSIGADHVAEYTIDRFSGGGGGGGSNNPGAFPVELLSFTGYNFGDENILEWTTSKEINNKEFVLMHSIDNISFEPIATVPTLAPSGMSNTPLNYAAKDMDFASKTYYRLQQIDIDGQSRLYSNTVEINVNNDLNTIVSLFPNPAKDVLNVSITQPQGGKHKVEVYDAIGKLVSSHKMDLNGGNNVLTLDVSTLAKGTYIIMVKNADNGTVANTRFVKE